MEPMLAKGSPLRADSKGKSAGMFLACLILWSCASDPVGGPAVPSPPNHVLSKDSFVMVMAEIQLVEASLQLRIHRNDNERMRMAEAYNDVWHRTGVSASQFETSHAWWWSHPSAMKDVLRDAVDLLKTMEARLNHADTASTNADSKFRAPQSGDRVPSLPAERPSK